MLSSHKRRALGDQNRACSLLPSCACPTYITGTLSASVTHVMEHDSRASTSSCGLLALRTSLDIGFAASLASIILSAYVLSMEGFPVAGATSALLVSVCQPLLVHKEPGLTCFCKPSAHGSVPRCIAGYIDTHPRSLAACSVEDRTSFWASSSVSTSRHMPSTSSSSSKSGNQLNIPQLVRPKPPSALSHCKLDSFKRSLAAKSPQQTGNDRSFQPPGHSSPILTHQPFTHLPAFPAPSQG